MDEEIALLNYVASTYIDAGYYITDSKRLDHLSKILPKLPIEIVEHILGVKITPLKFREHELLFFVGKKWRQKLVGRYNRYTLAPIPPLFFEKPFPDIGRLEGARVLEHSPELIKRFGATRTGGPPYAPYVAPPQPGFISDDESDQEEDDDIVQFTDEE